MFRTERDYTVALMDLGMADGVPRPYAAVLRKSDVPLPLVVAARAEPLLREHAPGTGWVGAAILSYLAQTGRVLPGKPSRVRWPPTPYGELELRQTHWKRLLAPAAARSFLEEANELLVDAGQRSQNKASLESVHQALSQFPLRSSGVDSALYALGRWRGGDLDYGPSSEPAREAVGRDLSERLATWTALPRPKPSFAAEVQSMVVAFAEAGDVGALAALRDTAMLGFTVCHAGIQYLQAEALQDLDAEGELQSFMAQASGIHDLLYGQQPAFGFGSWQFSVGPKGRVRMHPPELLMLSTDFLGRAWLNGLLQSHADRDESGITNCLAQFGRVLSLVASTHAGGTGGPGWRGFASRRRTITEAVPDDHGDDSATKLARQHLWATIPQLLNRKQWEVVFLIHLAGYSQAQAAEKLGITESAVSQRLKSAFKRLQDYPDIRDLLEP